MTLEKNIKTIRKKSNVDIVSVSIKQKNNEASQYSFDKILLNKDFVTNEVLINNKLVHFRVLENNDEYIIGLITATLDKDLPPKINKRSRAINSIGINEDEGLLYGNVLLYSKKMNILFYEVNKDSIYLNAFKKFIFKVFMKNEDFKSGDNFDIDFGTIFKKNEYERAIALTSFKKFKLKIHQPARLLEIIKKESKNTTYNKIKQDLTNQLETASKSGSEVAEIKYSVNQVRDKKRNLNKEYVLNLVKYLGKKIKNNEEGKEYIDVMEICGYEDDYDTRITPVDLIGDVVKGAFEIEIDRISNSLKETVKSNKIKSVYEEHKESLLKYV